MWTYAWVRGLVAVLAGLVLVLAALVFYVMGTDLSQGGGDPQADRSALPWLVHPTPVPRGRILAVVSSTPRTLEDRYRAGYELTELARAWWVFEAAGFEVHLASPAGGEAPRVVDDDLVDADHAFLNDPLTRAAMANTRRLDELDPADYVAVYVVGGKGAMFDLRGNLALQRLVAGVYGAGGVIAAVCHGPAALLELPTAPGRRLLDGRRVTGFSNAEERFLIDDPVRYLGFLLQDALAAEGEFVEGPMYLEHVVVDGRVLTGQNPWSTWALAEATVRALGVEPAARPRSAEEHAVDLLALADLEGHAVARTAKSGLAPVDNRLLLMHALVAGMQGQVWRSLQLLRLARA